MSAQNDRLYAETPPVRLFFKAALPGVVSMFAMSIYNIIEGILIGQFAGAEAFAAMALAMPFVMINFALSDMIGVGSSIPISIAHGEKDEERASNIFSCAVAMIIAVAILMGTFMFFLAPSLLRLMGAEAEVARLATQYLRIAALFGPFITITFAMDNFLRICGYIRGSMYLNVFMCALQIALLILFVVVWGMGLIGSCIAIHSAMALCSAIALIPFVRGRAALKFVRPRFRKEVVRQIIACGLPNFLNNISGRLFSLIMNALLIRMGGTLAVSVFSVLMYASDLIQPALYGLCDSMQPSIGYNWGAKAYDRVKSLAKCVFNSAAIVSVISFVFTFGLAGPLVSMFVHKDETELMQLSVHALKLFSLKMFVWWFGFAGQSFFNAIEKPKYSAILTVSSALVCPLIAVGLLWPMQLDGLWLNQAVAMIPVDIIAFVLLRRVQRSIAAAKKAA